MGSSDETAVRGSGVLRVEGRVGRSGPIPIARLLTGATVVDDGRVAIAVLDVLAVSRLSSAAEVALIRGTTGRSVALPVRAILTNPRVRFVVALGAGPLQLVLEAPDWIDDDVVVCCLTALTFAEFLAWR